MWTCPCSDWSTVDKYNLNLIASDGEIDYTHISRTDGKCPNFTQNILIKKTADLYFLLQTLSDCQSVEYVTRLRSCMQYSVDLTAYQGPEEDSAIEEYIQLNVTTLESSKATILIL